MNAAWVVVSVLACQGCNQLLDLDRITVGDRDQDGSPDPLDNCPDLANPEQLDSDDDGRGDACDGCDHCAPCEAGDSGADHDEDGDRYADSCDNCPAVSNDQTNGDGDDLGDACDGKPTMQHRLLFDGFGTLDQRWSALGDWRAVNDAAEVFRSPHPADYRLITRDALLDGHSDWRVETRFAIPTAPVQADSIGLHFTETTNVLNDWGCTVLFDSNVWNLTNGLPTPVVLPAGSTTMIVRATPPGATHYCAVNDGSEKPNTLTADVYPFAIELFTGPETRFEYIDVTEDVTSE